MTLSASEKRTAFRALHDQGCFVLPNPWDVGGARLLQSLGFKALASTSAGFAWSIGKADNAVTRDEVLAHLASLCAATDLPVNADFEGGFADAPKDVAANVILALKTGVAGLSIEDRALAGPSPLYDHGLAVERIAAARSAMDAEAPEAILVARCEAALVGPVDLDLIIARLTAFAEAGADCLFAPGLSKPEQISAVVAAVAPKPVNVVLGLGATVAGLAGLGVRRVSVGGGLSRAAWTGFIRAARELATDGTLTSLEGAVGGGEINGLFR
ncbi:MAG: isocitrate lyase/phosphoenolpyruvate mutase family protein [Caulobacteraceae bacterium]|nr:isocitrate lyase/phosphoenolpyruvate mutase family protein [Caulobacteraceae bacterium]